VCRRESLEAENAGASLALRAGGAADRRRADDDDIQVFT